MLTEPISTRGASSNPVNRFEKIHLEPDEDWNPEENPLPRTQFLRDRTSTIITYNDSPDVGFEASINPYRGCEHGCIYCYARPTHEYLGISSGLDFETKIMVKENAPALLRAELSSPRWRPQVLAEFRNPVCLITKNQLVTRDVDLLGELARHHAAAVFISLTTLDTELRKVMEPRTAPPAARLATIKTLGQAGIPVGVLVAPVIPGLTDHEIPSLVQAAVAAGARFAGHVTLRLPHAVAPLFEQWLENHFPNKKEKVLNRLRALRGGKLYDAEFGKRMRGEGIFAEQMDQLFDVACRKAGISGGRSNLSTESFRRPEIGRAH